MFIGRGILWTVFSGAGVKVPGQSTGQQRGAPPINRVLFISHVFYVTTIFIPPVKNDIGTVLTVRRYRAGI